MSETSMALVYDDLRQGVGEFLGFTRNIAGWTAASLLTANAITMSGIAQACYPPVLPGQSSAHEWSFLKVVTTFDTIVGQLLYHAPGDYNGIDGDMTILQSNSTNFPIEVVPEPRIRRLQSLAPTATGRPENVAEIPTSSGGLSNQQFDFMVWPSPDAAYPLSYRYKINPLRLTSGAPYPPGGPQHAEMFMESCLAVAERRRDGVIGIHYQAFMERLAASVSQDLAHKPQNFGYNGDPSCKSWSRSGRILNRTESALYKGQLY